jgi:hypothetical protein
MLRTANWVFFTNRLAGIGEYVCLDGARWYNGLKVVHVLVNFLPGNSIENRLPNPKNVAVKESRDAVIYQFGHLGLSYGTRIQERRSSATPQRIFRSTGRCRSTVCESRTGRSAPSPRGRCRFSSQGQTTRAGNTDIARFLALSAFFDPARTGVSLFRYHWEKAPVNRNGCVYSI